MSSRGGSQTRQAESQAKMAPVVDAGVAPSPRETKKRAPRGTFDRTAYQRELMRKRRAEGKA